jgi:hypothetical protein
MDLEEEERALLAVRNRLLAYRESTDTVQPSPLLSDRSDATGIHLVVDKHAGSEQVARALQTNLRYQSAIKSQIQTLQEELLHLERNSIAMTFCNQNIEMPRRLASGNHPLFYDRTTEEALLVAADDNGSVSLGVASSLEGSKQWSGVEKKSLRQAMKLYILHVLEKIIVAEHHSPVKILSFDLKAITQDLSQMQKESLACLWRRWEGLQLEIDWKHVAVLFMGQYNRTFSLCHRSPIECRQQWMYSECPSLNQQPFTPAESATIIQWVAAQTASGGKTNGLWDVCAEVVGGHRTAVQCLSQYRRLLQEDKLNSRWSEEEDMALVQAVGIYGEGNWSLIAAVFDGKRNADQCLHRWTRTLLNPSVTRGRWSQEEDELLLLAVAEVGSHAWTKIAALVPGRTDIQCRDRYLHGLNPGYLKRSWQCYEEWLLFRALMVQGSPSNFVAIAAMVKTRSEVQCRTHWRQMAPQAANLWVCIKKESRKLRVGNLMEVRQLDRKNLSQLHKPTENAQEFVKALQADWWIHCCKHWYQSPETHLSWVSPAATSRRKQQVQKGRKKGKAGKASSKKLVNHQAYLQDRMQILQRALQRQLSSAHDSDTIPLTVQHQCFLDSYPFKDKPSFRYLLQVLRAMQAAATP